MTDEELAKRGIKLAGYLPGALAETVRLHMEYYAPQWNFGVAFETKVASEMAEFLEMQGFSGQHLWGPKGCDKCRSTGYSGRVGLYEILSVDDQLRDVVARNPNVSEFRRMCIDRGMVTLRQDGMKKVMEGLTTVQEVLRVADAG